jgi:hypothetical protein
MCRLRASSTDGQATIEALLSLSFITLLMGGYVALCLIGATKSMVDLAAFSAARSVLVSGADPGAVGASDDLARIQAGWPAAWQVLDNIRWWSNDSMNGPDLPLGLTWTCPDGRLSWSCQLSGRKALTVTYRVPLGRPILDSLPAGGLPITAASPYVIQHQAGDPTADIPEEGDNASP